MATSTPSGAATKGIDQPSRRSSGATAREVTTSKRSRPCRVVGPAAHDRHLLERQIRDDLLEERRSPQEWLDKGDRQVGASDGQHDTRQAGTGPDVAHPRTFRDRFGKHGAVEQVSIPQARHLPRAEQATDRARVGQPGGVRLRDGKSVGSKDPPRRFGRGGCRFT